ncbi:host specificity factor TipJ family phage tail protein [Phytohalomonas tamaricis]|uniref:host specificity factor TipJ family phage tail protein n=1 Tax=Phytohalomonas tamaricis TaxID=2081032 RepID=UPI000D0AD4BF|nr:host specificity factor TipJ family phage tail protein [Phytohalomonas tamaricis]
MLTIVIHRDPVSRNRDLAEVPAGRRLIEYIQEMYAPGFGGIETDVIYNGVNITSDLPAWDSVACDGDVLTIVHNPSGLDPITITIIAVVALVALQSLIPRPTIPQSADQSYTESPNNSLKGQTNIARPYQAIPEIFGRVVAYPDLIQPSIYEYRDNLKYVREVFCLGVGEYEIHQVRTDQSPLDNVPGASYTIHGPGSVPENLLIARESNEINGQELTDRSGTADDPGDITWIGWFQLADYAEQVWNHFQLPQGLRAEDGSSLFVEWKVQIQQTDIDGNVIGEVVEYTYYKEDRTLDPRFYTEKVIVAPGYYRVRAGISSAPSKNAGDSRQVKWETAVAIRAYSGSGFGNVTTVDVTTKATEYALSSSERKINLECTRKLYSYRDSEFTGRRGFADAFRYTMVEAAGRDLDEVDLESAYAIQDELQARQPELSYFDFSMDDSAISLGERVKTICNAARVGVYRDGGVWRCFREEGDKPVVAMFNRRNIASGDNQQQTYSLQRPSDYNGVTLAYTDPSDDSSAEIRLVIDSDGNITEGLASRPNELDLAGCRNKIQAQDRAWMEALRLVYQRRKIVDKVLSDGYLVDFGDRVKYVDIYDTAEAEGEILSIDGYRYTMSERVDWQAGVDYVVYMTDQQGNVSDAVPVTPIDSLSFSAYMGDFSPFISDFNSRQAGSRYLIALSSDPAAHDYVVTGRKPKDNGLVELTLQNYDERMFARDY